MTPGGRLDPLIHDQARVAIIGRLVVFPALQFARLREMTGLTAGNLASHLRTLEEAGYVARRQTLIQHRPSTVLALTTRGRRSFQAYLKALEAMLKELRALRPASDFPPELSVLFPDLADEVPASGEDSSSQISMGR